MRRRRGWRRQCGGSVHNRSLPCTLKFWQCWSTTAVYSAHYGSPNDDNDFVIDLLDDDLGLNFMPRNETNIDDDDYVKIDSELEDEARSSFLMNQNPSMNLIIGGPQSTNTTGMTASKAKFTKESDQKRKQWTNMKCLKRLKQNTVGSSPHRSLGVVDDTLRTMVDIEVNRLYV